MSKRTKTADETDELPVVETATAKPKVERAVGTRQRLKAEQEANQKAYQAGRVKRKELAKRKA